MTVIVSDDFVTTAEHSMADTIMEFYSTSRSDTVVTPDGVSPPSFAAATDFAGTLDSDLTTSRK
jgi:hypothetical protein